MIQRVSLTLLEQIDGLTQIATEFSNFAKMPKAENEKILINDLVSSVHDLFPRRMDFSLSLKTSKREVMELAKIVARLAAIRNKNT